jgi:squalene-hopene/tetraprenyl-beta-curcumene cyclase
MGTKGLFYYYTILSKALTAAGGANLRRPDGTEIEWKKQLVDRLVSIQSPDGSWVNRNNQFWEGDAALVTAYSVLALEYAMDR